MCAVRLKKRNTISRRWVSYKKLQGNPTNCKRIKLLDWMTWATSSSHQFTLFATRVNISNEPRKTLGSTQNILAKHCKFRNLLIFFDIVSLNYMKIRLKRNVFASVQRTPSILANDDQVTEIFTTCPVHVHA